MVEYLMLHGYNIVIASPMKGRADEMISGNPLGASVDWSMDDPETLNLLISGSDVVVSLLPYAYHAEVARICIALRRPLVTTTQTTAELDEMDNAAKEAGIVILNEMGLDPGIDHMSAMKMINMIHSNGGLVEEFYSISGALPAPEAADNPMRYKFSHSPKGILLSSLNNAIYLHHGEKVEIPSGEIFRNTFFRHIEGPGELEVYPFGDSSRYAGIYGIPGANTIYRGKFRYRGWCETMDAFNRLKLFDNQVKDYSNRSYSGFLTERSGLSGDLKQKIADSLNLDAGSAPIRSLEFLGFFSDEKLEYYETTPFEITSDRMINKMMLKNWERDMVVLHNIFLASWANGKKEVIRSSMLDYGTPATNTAISRTVALASAIAVKLILEGQIKITGVRLPVFPEIYTPVLDELKTLGIEMREEYWLPETEVPVF